jgi:hypothetical protein
MKLNNYFEMVKNWHNTINLHDQLSINIIFISVTFLFFLNIIEKRIKNENIKYNNFYTKKKSK